MLTRCSYGNPGHNRHLYSRRLRPHGGHQRPCRLRRYSGGCPTNERRRPDRAHRQQHRYSHCLPWRKCLQHDQGCAYRACSGRCHRSGPARHHGKQCSARTHSDRHDLSACRVGQAADSFATNGCRIGGRQLRLLTRVGRSGLHHRSQPYHRRRIRRIIGTRTSKEKRRMSRPKEFDQEKALREAIRLFSQQGFAATSTDELMRVMNVGRQSMYDTFGDKRALFLKALKMYVTGSIHSLNAELERPGSALSAVQNALMTFAQRKDLSSAEGCMGLNAISEFGQRDAGVTRITRDAARLQRQTLMRVLTRAKKQREIRSDADLDSMADFFESTLAGIRMAAVAAEWLHGLLYFSAFFSML